MAEKLPRGSLAARSSPMRDSPIGDSSLAEVSEVSSVDSENEIDVVEDTPARIIQSVISQHNGDVLGNPSIAKRIFSIFEKERSAKEGEAKDEANLVLFFVDSVFKDDLKTLDCMAAGCLHVYNPVTRHQLRVINMDHSKAIKEFVFEDKSVIDLNCLLLSRKATSVDTEEGQLLFIKQTLRLCLFCFELGLIHLNRIREVIKLLFLKTEQLFKIEQHVQANEDMFREEIFTLAIDCKSLASRTLLHLLTVVNDAWLFQELVYSRDLRREAQLIEDARIAKDLKNKSGQGTVALQTPHLLTKNTSGLLSKIFKKGKVQQLSKQKDNLIFFEDSQYYSLFSFMMFNYLLTELRKDERVIDCKLHQEAMHQLILYVYDYREDAFMLSMQLLKTDYLPYYLEESVDEDHFRRADKIIVSILSLQDQFTTLVDSQEHTPVEGKKSQNLINSIEKVEVGITNLFSELEMLMGLQDETYSIRLLLTERKVPELLIEIFLCMQNSLICDSGDELFLQGIKVLYQLCRGNFPGQAQITKGTGWAKFKELLLGNFSVFSILFLKQLFEEDEDCRFLHINTTFAFDLLDIFSQGLDRFLATFSYENIGSSSKELVFLYSFQLLTSLFMKDQGIEIYLKQSYHLPIAVGLHKTIVEFVLPLFKNNPMRLEAVYEPKLIKKNWKLEDGSFLISLMMLTGDHIKSMVADFAYACLKVYNHSCEKYYPGSFVADLTECFPMQTGCYNYLFGFTEGLKFKTEILVSYCTFMIFGQTSRINQSYSSAELSTQASDTNQEYMPKSHIVDIPRLIVQEMSNFEACTTQELIGDELIDYVLRGLCQIIVKYVNGVVWFFSSIDSEENLKALTKSIHEINQRFHNLKMIVNKLKRIGQQGRSLFGSRIEIPFNDDGQMLMGSSIASLISNISELLDDTQYSWILKHYQLNKKYVPIHEMKIVQELLQNEANFLGFVAASSRAGGRRADPTPELQRQMSMGMSSHPDMLPEIIKYKKLKYTFMTDPGENQFFRVLQSKMGNVNQRNLVTYIINWMDSIDIDVTSLNSIWINKPAIQMIVFLSNTMYWCPQARIKLFEALEHMPEKRARLLAIIYKGLRDSFTMLNYSPFINDNWQYVFSRYFIFSSFITGLCKQNCQEFKVFLGEFVPDLGCPNHKKLKLTLLGDLMNVLVKFLHYSGVSFNKSSTEKSSDRLSTVGVTEIIMRCITDTLTGPCKPNQVKAYFQGNQIWQNMFNRLVTDLGSKYYKLLDNSLDYLLSLLEGNEAHIMNYFANNFDIPVLYGLMVNLMVLLYKRVIGKVQRKGTLKTGTFDSTTAMLKTPRNEKDEAQGSPQRNLDAVVEQPSFEQAKLSDWQSLIEMYRSGDFDDHVTLECSIKIFIFLSRVAYTSKKYQIFFDKKEKDMHEQYVRSGFKEEDIKTNKVNLSGSAGASEDLIVYYFMKTITARVEIRDNNNDSEIFIFPKPPCCFFLKEATKINFINTCQIENTEAKLIDMFENFDQFHLEMQNYQKFKSKYRALGLLATDKAFAFFRIGCYFLSVIINLLLLVDVRLTDYTIQQDLSEMPILILSILLITSSGILLVLWIISNYWVAWSSVLTKFMVKYPYKNPLMPNNLIVLLSDIFLRGEVINFLLHIFFAFLGIVWSPIAQTFHLILIINISSTTKYVLKAVMEHADQLLATVLLVIIVIFIFSFYIGLNYGRQFKFEESQGMPLCSSLVSCYLTVLNLGLTRGGGIAESLEPTSIDDKHTNFYSKILIEVGFYVFVNVICLNVIFGIIIDTFSELRDKQRMREWDQYNMCDICGIERKIFEKKGNNFDIHKGVQHNLWDYVFYLVYLQTLDVQSLTGFEYFVFSQFKNKSTAWLPINSTLFLKDTREDEQLQINQLEKKMTDFRSEITSLVETRFSHIDRMLLTLGRKVDRAMLSLRDTKDIYNGEEAKEGDTNTSDVIRTEEIRVIGLD